jgi:predicted RND superfamily exporter protein
MASADGHNTGGIGRFVITYRAPIGILLIAVTAFMAYWAAHAQVGTQFNNFFPANHSDTKLYRKFQYQYGGAQTLVILMRLKHGDIFNARMLHKIQDVTFDANTLPGVNHNEIFSLASLRNVYAEEEPGAIISKCFMYPWVPETPAGIAKLRRIVETHRESITPFVNYDDRGAVVTASFVEDKLDYKALFDGIQGIIHKYQDDNTEFYVAGLPVIAGWGYHYLPRIMLIFFLSIALMLIILYLSLGQRSSWWAPILTGSFSAIWGLGFIGLMGYNFDPVMLVIPFILTARDLSHGIQWQGRYYNELDALDDKTLACITTTNVMLPPGLLSIIADIAGIIFISLGGIPVLKEIGFGGAVWLAGSVTMVFVFQPIFMSYLPRPTITQRRWWQSEGRQPRRMPIHALGQWLVKVPVTPGAFRTALLVGGALFIVWGISSGQRARIGYQQPGTPLYKPDSKVNRDMDVISHYLPTDEGWVVLKTPDFPSAQSSIAPNVMRMVNDMQDYLLNRGDVLAVVSFAGVGIAPINQMFHNGYPKYRNVPSSIKLAGALWYMFLGGTAPGEIERFFAYSPKMTSSCIRLMLKDHTYDRLNSVRRELRDFVATHVRTNPELSHVQVEFLGGDSGLYLAADDVLYRLDLVNITFVLLVIYLCCTFSFRSPIAGGLFIVSAVMANFGAFIYMNARGIGLTIDTIPVISLGIGLGIDYGIYVVARIQDEVKGGATIEEAVTTALSTTGAAVFSTFAVMVGGILPWAFSPLLFHNEMSVLLIFLMGTNMIAGCLILPSFIAWYRPHFISQFLHPRGAKPEPADRAVVS